MEAPVVKRVDSAIQRINHYPVDSAIGFHNTYPLDSDLSSGWGHPTFEQPGPDYLRIITFQPHFDANKIIKMLLSKVCFFHIVIMFS